MTHEEIKKAIDAIRDATKNDPGLKQDPEVATTALVVIELVQQLLLDINETKDLMTTLVCNQEIMLNLMRR